MPDFDVPVRNIVGPLHVVQAAQPVSRIGPVTTRARDSFTGVVDLQAAIKRYIAEHNRRARPFIWTKSAADLLAVVS